MTPEHRRATHPGVFLLGEMLERNMRPSEFARMCGLPMGWLEELLLGERSVTPDIAAGLTGLGTSERLWLNLQASYDRSAKP